MPNAWNAERISWTCGQRSSNCSRFSDIRDRKSTRLNSSHLVISYAVFCLKKKKTAPLLDHVRPADIHSIACLPSHALHAPTSGPPYTSTALLVTNLSVADRRAFSSS